MLYAIKMSLSDAAFYVENSQGKYIFLDQRESGVFEEMARKLKLDIKVESFEKILAEAQKQILESGEDKKDLVGKIAMIIVNRYGMADSEIEVSNFLPLNIADYLRGKGVKLKPVSNIFPERTKKSVAEKEFIKSALRKTCEVFKNIEKILKESVIDGEFIKYKGEILTSEFLKKESDLILAGQGMIDVEGMIIASGTDSSMSHHRGGGPIKPNAPIVCDIFPRDKNSGYFADMTRTYVKGRPSSELIKMYETVKAAQEICFGMIKDGVAGKSVYEGCAKFFTDAGYDVGAEKGFTHSVGHGLGLNVHEAPGMGLTMETVLAEGNVVTVEPGLYYPEIGGIRIEDVVYVTKNGFENLTNYPKEFVIL